MSGGSGDSNTKEKKIRCGCGGATHGAGWLE